MVILKVRAVQLVRSTVISPARRWVARANNGDKRRRNNRPAARFFIDPETSILGYRTLNIRRMFVLTAGKPELAPPPLI
jgi:hypothetical protein